jgi:hypothetical protein
VNQIKPDVMLWSTGPEGCQGLVLELTCPADTTIMQEERLFLTKEWKDFVSKARDDNEDPFRFWDETKGSLTELGRDPAQFPQWLKKPSDLTYSPVARYNRRTFSTRTRMSKELGYEVRLIVIEIGVRGYVSKLTVDSMDELLAPLLTDGRRGVRRILQGLVHRVQDVAIDAVTAFDHQRRAY